MCCVCVFFFFIVKFWIFIRLFVLYIYVQKYLFPQLEKVRLPMDLTAKHKLSHHDVHKVALASLTGPASAVESPPALVEVVYELASSAHTHLETGIFFFFFKIMILFLLFQ